MEEAGEWKAGAKTPLGSPLRAGFAIEEEEKEDDVWDEGYAAGLKGARREGMQELLCSMADYIASRR